MTCLASCNFGLKKVFFLLLCSPLLLLMTISTHAQTYTSDANIADFTALVPSYATFSNYSANQGCTPTTFTPTSAELATTGCRVYDGTFTNEGLPANNWIIASFSTPVSTIVVFPSIDHFGSAYDGYQYQIYGSNDMSTWTALFNATAVSTGGEPFTLVSFTGTAPTTVNNVLTPQSTGLPAGCSGTATPCAVGYIAQFTFSTPYLYYAFGASTVAIAQGNADQELSAVGAPTVVQTFNTTAPTIANFTTGTNVNTQTLDLTTANNNLICNNTEGGSGACPTTTLATTNSTIPSDSTWPQFVGGTPWATSVCAARPANGGAGNLCSLFVNACFGGTVSQSQASDFFCPSVSPGAENSTITIKDTWAPLNPKPDIASGTTVSLVDFVPGTASETWTASAVNTTNPVCTNVLGPSTFKCDISDTLTQMYGDQTTTKGSKPKKGWIVTVFNVPMLTTTWSVVPGGSGCPTPATKLNNPPSNSQPSTAWFNGACLVQFEVDQASLANPTNGYVAAPPASLNYGLGPAKGSDQHFPPTSDQSQTNSGLASPWISSPGTLQQVLNAINGGGSSDGAYVLHWSGVDNVGISEKHIQLIPTGSVTPCDNPEQETGLVPPCYNTELFTTNLNMDSVAPVATCTSADATWHKTDVSVNCTATDATSGIGVTGTTPTVTGVPSAGGAVVNFTVSTNVSGTPPYWSANASTSSQTLCDLASNCSTTSVSGFKIDEVPPTVGPITFSPASAGNVYTQGASVTALFASCGDVGSGLASCVGNGSIVSGGSIVTSTIGNNLPFTVVATDLAGNTTSSTVYYSVIAPTPPADVALFEQETSDTPKHGATLNYIVWAIDLTKGASASNVIVNFSIPAGVAGSVTGKVADVSCNLLTGCSAMPPSGGSTCSVSPDNTQVSCNIGTLASIYTLKGAVAKISIPIAAPTGSKFNISATVTSANDPNAKNNTLVDSITVK